VDVRPEVTVTAGGGTVRDVFLSSVYPGFYGVRVLLGPSPGLNTFEIGAQGTTTSVSISAR
jgi:hypothetical protein